MTSKIRDWTADALERGEWMVVEIDDVLLVVDHAGGAGGAFTAGVIERNNLVYFGRHDTLMSAKAACVRDALQRSSRIELIPDKAENVAMFPGLEAAEAC